MANVGTTKANYYLKFLGNNRDGSTGPQRNFESVPAGRSATYADVLKSVFNLDSDFGAIEVGSVEDLVVMGQTSTPGFGGTFGQSGPAMANEDLVRYQSPRSIVAVREDSKFRTNLILCSTTEFVSVDVTLVGPDGIVLGTKRYTLPSLGMTQVSRVALALGGPANLNGARLDLSTPTRGGAFATVSLWWNARSRARSMEFGHFPRRGLTNQPRVDAKRIGVSLSQIEPQGVECE